MSYPPINIPGLTLPDVPSVATNSAGPMLPEPVECGTPCGACEALAHTNAKLREEIESVRKGAAHVCRELRAEVARLRDALCNAANALESEIEAERKAAWYEARAHLAGEAKP